MLFTFQPGQFFPASTDHGRVCQTRWKIKFRASSDWLYSKDNDAYTTQYWKRAEPHRIVHQVTRGATLNTDRLAYACHYRFSEREDAKKTFNVFANQDINAVQSMHGLLRVTFRSFVLNIANRKNTAWQELGVLTEE